MNNLRHRFNTAGFTLIELLVVIGLIAVLSAGIGIALTTGGKGNALQSSQGIINSVLSGARGQAAIKQANAAVMVNVLPAADGFLSEFYIATQNAAGDWITTGDPTRIDKDIYLVPPAGGFSTTTEVQFDTTNGVWTNLSSTAYETAGADLNIFLSDGTTKLKDDDGTTNLVFRIVQIYTPRGVVDTAVPARPAAPQIMKLVLSTAQRASAPILTFDKPQAVRGVLITDYGIPIFVNDALAFNP